LSGPHSVAPGIREASSTEYARVAVIFAKNGPMHEYFIEKRRLPVELELVSGTRLSGDLFIQSSWRGPSVLEDAPEYMNAQEEFFPLQTSDGATQLIARRHVVVLKVASTESREGGILLGDPVRVAVQLSTGSRVAGTLLIEPLTAHTRVLDFLNYTHEPFLTLHDPEGDLVVNRAHILSISEEQHGAD
jgi:hypothetical protein